VSLGAPNEEEVARVQQPATEAAALRVVPPAVAGRAKQRDGMLILPAPKPATRREHTRPEAKERATGKRKAGNILQGSENGYYGQSGYLQSEHPADSPAGGVIGLGLASAKRGCLDSYSAHHWPYDKQVQKDRERTSEDDK